MQIVALYLSPPRLFFSKVWHFHVTVALQSSRLTSVIIIIPLALLERHDRRHSNKSSNSLLLNHIVNFRYLFFILFDYVPTWYELYLDIFF